MGIFKKSGFKREKSDWIELVAAVLLALATVATAWCAYQSARWSGVMTIEFSTANAKRSSSVKASNNAVQKIAFEATALVDYVLAYQEGDEETMDLYEEVVINNRQLSSWAPETSSPGPKRKGLIPAFWELPKARIESIFQVS